MKQIFKLVIMLVVAVGFASCNNEWENEQFAQYVSFKSVPNTLGVTDTYVRYKTAGEVTYELPIIISGSTNNKTDRVVKVAIDPDTLADLNVRKFGGRQELYFEELPSRYYSFPSEVTIPAGQSQGVLPITFKLQGLDQSVKWVLPITIVDEPGTNYKANPRQYYRKAILRINPFNDFSGTYSGSQLMSVLSDDPSQKANRSDQRCYVVNDSTVFFYAGLRDIDYLDRRNYKVFFHFTKERYRMQKYYVDIYAENPELNFKVNGRACYSVVKEMDATKTYLQHTYITIENIDYEFTDYTTIPTYPLRYHITGSLTLQRDLNTLIPDQDQGIQW